MGDWRLNPDLESDEPWLYDPDAPTPDSTRAQEPATSMLPPQAWDPGSLYVMPIVGRRIEYGAAVDYPTVPPEAALTAGEQDHSDPWRYAGEDADPPADTGRPADD